MPTGMGVVDPKLVRGGRKLKRVKHCTIPNLEQNDKKRASELEELKMKHRVEKEKAIVGNMYKDAPKQVWGSF